MEKMLMKLPCNKTLDIIKQKLDNKFKRNFLGR